MQDVHPTAEDGTKMYAFELSPESDKATNSNPWSAAFRLYGMSGFQDVRGFLVYDIQNDELKPILGRGQPVHECCPLVLESQSARPDLI